MNVDTTLLHTLYALRDPSTTHVFIWITELGSTVVIGGISLVAGLWLIFRKHLSSFAGLCVSIMGTAVVVFALKEFIARARPDAMYQAYAETGFSFPSGHAAFSLALYGFLTYLAWKYLTRREATAVSLALGILIVLIGFSRLYLGLHFASDVLGGYAVGGGMLALGIWLSERLTRSRVWS